MKNTFTTVLILFCLNISLAQEESTRDNIEYNTVYAEAFGQGFCWSLNYDRLFNTEKTFMNSVTAGVVYVPEAMEFGDGVYFGIPLSYNWLLGKKSHHLELGIGLTSMWVNPSADDRSTFYVYATPKIGYRFQRPQGGLFFRATATPMLDVLNVNTYKFGNEKQRDFSTLNNAAGIGYAAFPWVGLSIGYTF